MEKKIIKRIRKEKGRLLELANLDAEQNLKRFSKTINLKGSARRKISITYYIILCYIILKRQNFCSFFGMPSPN